MEAAIGIVAALIGAASALAATLIAGRRARRTEYQKEVRLSAAKLARTLGAASHSIEWLVWKAKYAPHEFGVESIADYNEEMHEALAEVVGDLAVVSALDPEIYARMLPLARELFVLDGQVALSAAAYSLDPTESVTAIARHADRALTYWDGLNEKVAGIMYQARDS